MNQFLSYCLFLLTVPYAAALRRELVTADDRDSERELFFDLPQYCENIEIEAYGIIECSCSAQWILPEFSAGCSPPDRTPLCPVTEKLLCGVPEVKFSVSLLTLFRLFSGGSPFNAEICYSDLTLGGFSVPGSLNDICFDFASPIFGGLASLVSGDSTTEANDQPYSLCTAKINGEQCEMCEPCDDGKGGTGVRFSCLDGAVASSTCSTIAMGLLPSSLWSRPKDLALVPPSVDGI